MKAPYAQILDDLAIHRWELWGVTENQNVFHIGLHRGTFREANKAACDIAKLHGHASYFLRISQGAKSMPVVSTRNGKPVYDMFRRVNWEK